MFSIEKMTIARCSADMVCEVEAHLSSNQSILGQGRTVSGDRTVVSVTGIVASAADSSAQGDSENFIRCRYTSDSDVHFADLQSLILSSSEDTEYMRELDDLCQICLLSVSGRVSNAPTSLLPYAAWIRQQTNEISSLECWKMNDNHLSAKLHDLVAKLS